MSMTINIQKPINVSEAIAKARNEAAKKGLSFYGDELSGRGEGYGFEASYVVQSDVIVITVDRKPFIIPESKIKKEVNKYWTKYLAEEKQASG